MDDKPMLVIKTSLKTRISTIVAAVFMLAITVFLFYTCQNPFSLKGALTFGVPLLVTLLLVALISNWVNLLVYPNRLEERSYYGKLKKTIQRSSITAWREVTRESKNSTVTFLVLELAEGNYAISSSNYTTQQYNDIKAELTRNVPHDTALEVKDKQQNRDAQIFQQYIMGAVCIAVAFFMYYNQHPAVIAHPLKIYGGALFENPHIYHLKRGDDIVFILNGHRGMQFSIPTCLASQAVKKGFITSTKAGDSVTVAVDQAAWQYLGRDTATDRVPPNGFTDLTVYNLQSPHYNFTEADYIAAADSNTNFTAGIFLALGSLLILLTYALSRIQAKKQSVI